MLTVLIWIACILLPYIFMAGLLRAPFAKLDARKCNKCVDGVHHYEVVNSYGGDSPAQMNAVKYHDGSVEAVFWVFMLPWNLGNIITDGNRIQKKAVRDEARRANEITEAKHQKELAKLRSEEDVYLTKQLQDK